MEILNNLEWYFFYDEPKEAKNRDTGEKIKKIQLNTIVFDKSVKENVITKLTDKINESDDIELKEKIGNTIQRIQESESDLVSLYKLKQLEQGL